MAKGEWIGTLVSVGKNLPMSDKTIEQIERIDPELAEEIRDVRRE